MKAYDSLELAARNLRESMLRNGLTTMGIAVGVASLVSMLSLGAGLQNLANRRLTRSGLFDTLIVYQQRPEFGGPRRQRPADAAPTSSSGEARPVDEAARQDIAKLKGVLEANPQIRFSAEIRYDDAPAASAPTAAPKPAPAITPAAPGAAAAPPAAPGAAAPPAAPLPRFSGISAIPMSARDTEAFESLQGKFFSSPDADEAILQSDLAKELTKTDAARILGHDIVLRYAERQQSADTAAPGDIIGAFNVIAREKRLRVVGLVDREPFGGGPMIGGNARVMIPQKTGERLRTISPTDLRDIMRSSAGGPTYASLIVHLARPEYVQAVEDEVKKMGFGTWSLLDASRNLQRFFAILDGFLGIFGSLALAVASLGIINTLVMAILERRREIGIMKAIGASDADVRGLFFAEAGAMGVLGGVLGVALGWAIGQAINGGTNIYLRRQDLPTEQFWMVPWWLVAGAIGFALVVSLVSGLYPASRAARLNPVEALRYE